MAEYLGIDPREVGYRNDRKRTIINSPQLRDARAANSMAGDGTESPVGARIGFLCPTG